MKRKLILVVISVLVASLLAGCMGTIVVVEKPVDETKPADVVVEAGALKTGLAIVTGVSKSVSAAEDADGSAEYDVTLAAVTVDDQGIIRSCRLDSIGTSVAFDATGVITTDLTAPVQTKNELGENYGMVAWGGAVAEWNEQAASFAAYVTNKTAADVAGIAVEEGKPTEADLVSSVTIRIGDFQALIAKAMG